MEYNDILAEREKDIEKGKLLRYFWSYIKAFLEDPTSLEEYFDWPPEEIYADSLDRRISIKISLDKIFQNSPFFSELNFGGEQHYILEFRANNRTRTGGGYSIEDRSIAVYIGIGHFEEYLLENDIGATDDHEKFRPGKYYGLDGEEELAKEMIHYIYQMRDEYRSVIIHEFQHLIDDIEYIGDLDDIAIRGATGTARYFNDPVELSAYFQAAAEEFFHRIREEIWLKRKFQRLMLAADGKIDLNVNRVLRDLLEEFQDSFRDGFWEKLTEENKKRIRKRMYSVLKEQMKEISNLTSVGDT